METNLLDGSLNPVNVARVIKHNHDFYKLSGYVRNIPGLSCAPMSRLVASLLLLRWSNMMVWIVLKTWKMATMV